MEHGQSSGVFVTTHLNSIGIHVMFIQMFYYCRWWQIYNQPPTHHSFISELHHQVHTPLASIPSKYYNNHKLMEMICLGDDTVICAPPEIQGVITEERVLHFASFVKMVVTPAQKHELHITWKKPGDIIFLKRTPVLYDDETEILGCLHPSSVAKMLAFTDSSLPPDQWKAQVIFQSFLEMSYYPAEVFDRYYEVFFKYYMQYKYPINYEDNLKLFKMALKNYALKMKWAENTGEDPELIPVVAEYMTTVPLWGSAVSASSNTNMTGVVEGANFTEGVSYYNSAEFTDKLLINDKIYQIFKDNNKMTGGVTLSTSFVGVVQERDNAYPRDNLND